MDVYAAKKRVSIVPNFRTLNRNSRNRIYALYREGPGRADSVKVPVRRLIPTCKYSYGYATVYNEGSGSGPGSAAIRPARVLPAVPPVAHL